MLFTFIGKLEAQEDKTTVKVFCIKSQEVLKTWYFWSITDCAYDH